MVAGQDANSRIAGFSSRELNLSVAGIFALFIGYTSHQGMPGSVMDIAIALLIASFVTIQFERGWTRGTLALATINSLAWLAVAIEPGPLNLSVMWFSLVGFALVQQNALLSNIFAMMKVAFDTLLFAPLGFIGELSLIRKVRNETRQHPRLVTLANIILPLAAIGIFGALLINANPLIESVVLQLSWESVFDILLSWTPLASVLAFLLIWTIFKIQPSSESPAFEGTEIWQQKFFMPVPVTITLLGLNGMFMLENILDLQYVWSDTILPAGMNYAEYVHRGSYTLIVTAILAGALMVFALQPGSKSEASFPVRLLVYAWTAQNVFLVASSAKRTLAYVDVYGMTLWRLSGLIWMGLVAAGLIFIATRVIFKHNNNWLLNVNLRATFVLLLFCSFVDFKGVVANWNVERALAQLGSQNRIQTIDLDLNYLIELGPSAISPLANFIALTPSDASTWTARGAVSSEATRVADTLCKNLLRKQANWKTMTLRGIWQISNSTCKV